MDTKISRISTVLIVLGGALAVYMSVRLVSFLGTHVWSDAAALARLFGFENVETQIPSVTRLLYSGVQSAPVLCGLVALYFGARLMNGFRTGRYFSPKTTQSMSFCGMGLVGVAIFAMLARIISGPLISQYDSVGRRFVSVTIDTYDLGFILAGLVMWVTGWVLTSAFALQSENESFV
ncbi:MAG: DUF2975 domain-containing protein [Planktomarina sp.]